MYCLPEVAGAASFPYFHSSVWFQLIPKTMAGIPCAKLNPRSKETSHLRNNKILRRMRFGRREVLPQVYVHRPLGVQDFSAHCFETDC